MQTIKVYAVADRKVGAIDSFGAPTRMRQYIGRDLQGHPIPEGESVLDCAYIRQCIAHGDLSLSPEVSQ